MVKLIIYLLSATSLIANTYYLDVAEKTPANPVCVRLEVVSMADASNKLASVIADYYAGLDYVAYYHTHTESACPVVPMANKGDTVTVETTDVGINKLPEYITVRATDLQDADKKAKKIKAKYFKDKPTKEKINGKAVTNGVTPP